MTLRTFFCAFFLFWSVSNFAIGTANFKNAPIPSSGNPIDCPPIANLELEFIPTNKLFASWDSIAGVDKYFVRVTSGNTVIVDTVVYFTPKVSLIGFLPGQDYLFQVCYKCPKFNNWICEQRNFTYLIVDDVLVMAEYDPCPCKKMNKSSEYCDVIGEPLYPMESPGFYYVTLENQSQMTFVQSGEVVQPIGNCELDFSGLSVVPHGSAIEQISTYSMGEGNIFFHGLSFCISGIAVESVRYCPFSDFKKTSDRVYAVEPGTVTPNPFSDRLVVELEDMPDTPVTISLYDASGRLVHSSVKIGAGAVLHTNQLSDGLYWLRVGSNGETLLSKAVVKKS